MGKPLQDSCVEKVSVSMEVGETEASESERPRADRVLLEGSTTDYDSASPGGNQTSTERVGNSTSCSVRRLRECGSRTYSLPLHKYMNKSREGFGKARETIQTMKDRLKIMRIGCARKNSNARSCKLLGSEKGSDGSIRLLRRKCGEA